MHVDGVDERSKQRLALAAVVFGAGAVEFFANQNGAQAEKAGDDERQESDDAGDGQYGLRRGIKAKRCARAGGNRMGADGDQQRVEGEQAAEADREVQVAVFEEFEVSDKGRVCAVAAHGLECAETVSEGLFHGG